MTDAEVNKKFDVVAGHLATLAVAQQGLTETVDRLTVKVDRLSDKVDRTADSVQALLAIAELHEGEITALSKSGRETDERLNALINTVERFISEGRGR